ncbi:MAG: rod shape-determining protein MreC [Candidatus Daviesbacteria bacterium]|nr:rod shape-determining protein MreC [Candidatus Daviesbacteria bacterium]
MSKVIPNLQLFLFLIFLSLLILGLDSLKLLQFLKSGAYYITNPVSFGFYKVRQTIGGQFYFIYEARFAAKENKALQEQIAQLVSENANLRRNLAESQAIVEQEKTLDPRIYNLLPARPIGIDRYLKIDKGANDGVKIGDAVVYKDNYLGQVLTVSTKQSSIRLLTDPDSKLSAFSISKEGKAKGLVRGDFGLEMVMDKILHEEKIGEGDLVYSEGTEGFLPRGLILGRITQVIDNQNEVFKQAKLKPTFAVQDLEVVFLIQQ